MKIKTQLDQDILIARYLTNEAVAHEIAQLEKWINSSEENLLYFQQLRNIWAISENTLSEGMIDIDKAHKLVIKKIGFRAPAPNFFYYWNKIAAVLIIPVIVGNLLFFLFHDPDSKRIQEPVYNELFAAFGTRSAIKLSDGTSVWLNSGSSIRYPDRFTKNNRKVFLKGEAYFEVESNPKKPFIVETSTLSVKATGTKFNVLGYSADNEAKVTLVSGKVEVFLTDNKNNAKSSTLKDNQLLIFNKSNGSTSITDVETYKYISWKDGKLVFRNEPLSEVVKKISQIFNIDIEIKGEEIQNYSYRATFQDESLSEILKLLKMSSPIDFTEVKRDPLPDGSFPRKKVIIFSARK